MTTEQPNLSAKQEADCAGGCSCSDTDETQEEPVRAEEPVAAPGGHASGCGGIATQFARGEAFAPIARCREMFARFMSAAAPAETNKAPAAPTETGACKKEA